MEIWRSKERRRGGRSEEKERPGEAEASIVFPGSDNR